MMFVVDDINEFHKQNFVMNKKHYPYALRMFKFLVTSF